MEVSESRRWLSVLALAFGAFVFNTSEFVPIALLSDIGASFALSPTQTGMMLTVYAWVVALASLPLMLMTRQWERRRLLLALFAAFFVSHVLSFFAAHFAVLLASRIGVALAHAVFWSITAALVVRIAPAGRGNQALGFLGMGTVLAMVLGIPIGRVIGNAYGWRLSFLGIGVAALAVAWVLARNLPALPSVNTGSLASVPLLLKRRVLLMLYGFTVLMVSAHFCAYSYIEPFVREVARFAPGQVTLWLLLYGAAGFLGSFLFGRCFAGHARRFFLACCVVLAAAMVLLYPLAAMPAALYVLAVSWGAAISALALAMMSRVLQFAPDATDVATSIHSALFNVGIGGGALLGRLAEGWFGLAFIGVTGGVLAVCALLLALAMVARADFVR